MTHGHGRRRKVRLRSPRLAALALETAVFQAVHKLERLGVHTHGVVLTAGGITYPLYLLHMQLGYVIYTATAPHRDVVIIAATTVAGAVFLAWLIWRFFERQTHRLVKLKLTEFADRLGWSSSTAGLTVQ